MELIEVPWGIIAVSRGRKGMSSEEGGNIMVAPRTQLSGKLQVRTEVFQENKLYCPSKISVVLLDAFCHSLLKALEIFSRI